MRGIYRNLRHRICLKWSAFWAGRSGSRGFGRMAAWIASINTAPYHQRSWLADLSPHGFIDYKAVLVHPDVRIGSHVYIGCGVIVRQVNEGGGIELGDGVQIYGNSFLDTGSGGNIVIGAGTHIQPGCHIHAYLSDIRIGKQVEIAPGCGFYCYNHGIAQGLPIMEQPLESKGDISVGDGAWIGHGVTVLQGVSIGTGAVVAAGAVVVHNLPDYSIAAGVPARVLRFRDTVDGRPDGVNHPATRRPAASFQKVKIHQ